VHEEGLLRLTEPDEKSSQGVVLSTIPREMADSTSCGCARSSSSGSPSMLHGQHGGAAAALADRSRNRTVGQGAGGPGGRRGRRKGLLRREE